jgi:PEP-CTERM motif
MLLLGRASVALASLAGFLVMGVATARAGTISFVDIFKNVDYLQTGNGNTVTWNGAFFSADLNSGNPNDYSNVTMTYPGPGSPVSLPEANPPSTDYHYQTTTFATQGDMNAAFPTGTYTFDADNSDTATLQYTGDDYAQSLPYLTGTDYSALQGMDPANAFTFTFSPFVTGSNAANSYVFFTIYDETLGETVYNGGFMSATTTSVTVPGGTLAFGDTFDYEIDFSNRDIGNGTGGVFSPELGFDTRTDGTFTTEKQPASVPEPATMILAGLGLCAVAAARRWKIVG